MDVKCPSILATDIHPCQDSANDQLSNCCSSSNVTLAVWRIWYFSDAALSDIDSDDEWGSARCGIIYQAMLPTPGTPLPESGDHWASALQYTALPIAHCTHSLLIAHHTQSLFITHCTQKIPLPETGDLCNASEHWLQLNFTLYFEETFFSESRDLELCHTLICTSPLMHWSTVWT